MAAILDAGKLSLSGFVGDAFFEDGFTSGDVALALRDHPDEDDLTVHINSGGGYTTEGAAIHAMLDRRSGRTDVVVDGIAASAASVIAMVGETITMSAGSIMMIHDPSGMTWGTAADHAKTIEALEATASSMAGVYASKSGKSAEDCRQIMKDERWLTPAQAVEEGFADGTTENRSAPVAAFDYRIYAHAPKHLKTLAAQKNWRLPDADHRAGMSASTHRQTQEIDVTEKERADQLAAENAKLKTDLDAANAAKTTATASASTTAAEIVDVCAKAGVPTMASALIREGLTVEQATARADSAKQIRAAVATAKKAAPALDDKLADTFIAAGMTMDQVRSKLFEQITASQSDDITSAHQAGSGTGQPKVEKFDPVANMKQRFGVK